MNSKNLKDEVQIAYDMYEHVYSNLNNTKNSASNEHSLGSPNRVEHDFSEREKEHLALLRAKLTLAIANRNNETLLESSKSSESLGRKVFWLNIVVAFLTAVMAFSAAFEAYLKCKNI